MSGSVIKVGVTGTAKNEIAVSVADHGPGIAPKEAEHIFDPFYSTKGSGLGVGLSISRAIVEAHGGRLSSRRTGRRMRVPFHAAGRRQRELTHVGTHGIHCRRR